MKGISPMQMKATDFWVDGGCKSKAEALRKAGYGASVVDQPHKVFDSPVVLAELEKRGFDRYGRRMEPEAFVLTEPERVAESQPTAGDFSKMSRETLQDLKERLADTPLPVGRPMSLLTGGYVPEGHLLNEMVAELEGEGHEQSERTYSG